MRNLYLQQDIRELDMHLETLAKEVVALLKTIKCNADIKFFDPTGKGTCLAGRFASKLQNKKCSIEDDARNASIVVLDRNFDLFCPIIHSLFYEAICYDIFQVTDGVVSTPNLPGELDPGSNLATFDDQDPIFCKLRHVFLGDIADVINDLVQNDPGIAVATAKSGDLSLADIRASMFGLTESQKV